jgi:hypothetical protein
MPRRRKLCTECYDGKKRQAKQRQEKSEVTEGG